MDTPKGVTLWLALWKATREMDRVAQNDITSLGLCLTDFGVLEVLLNRGPLPVNVIADKVMLTSGSMTTAVHRLAGKGLVRRTGHPRDGRVKVVALTDEGRSLIQPAYTAHARTIEGVFAPLTAEDPS
ncbi:MAG: MarR family transcriptional regulator, partial [Actinobacteria bacterium]|nr:MarR family transcriptional regulator [Actinomycetota bacterium]